MKKLVLIKKTTGISNTPAGMDIRFKLNLLVVRLEFPKFDTTGWDTNQGGR